MKHKWLASALGAVLTVFCGLLLWKAPLGEGWVNASYDYLFRFGGRAATNQVVAILTKPYDFFHQVRDRRGSRNSESKTTSEHRV